MHGKSCSMEGHVHAGFPTQHYSSWQRLLSNTNHLNGNGNHKVVTACFTTQTLNKEMLNVEKVILLTVHCVHRHIAVMSGVFMSANAFPTWNSDWNDCSISLFRFGGRIFPSCVPSRMWLRANRKVRNTLGNREEDLTIWYSDFQRLYNMYCN